MPLTLPSNARIAVCITCDFDAHSVWMGTFNATSPGYLSRGEFGAYVGVSRLLDLFKRHGVNATWCIPGHTLETFTEQAHAVVDAGHEVAAHGCYHEAITNLSPDTERRLMERQLTQHERVLEARPRGYRSPAWDYSDATLGILEEFGFVWDSSLMGRDFEPYHPRPVEVHWETGSQFGEESPVLEIPVSWYLDDFPPVEYIPSLNAGLASAEVMYDRWKTHFDYAYANVPKAVFTLTIHPQTSGRAHHLVMLERLIEHIRSQDGVWFATLGNVYDCWSDVA